MLHADLLEMVRLERIFGLECRTVLSLRKRA